LSRVADPVLVKQVWSMARYHKGEVFSRQRPCPICAKKMVEVLPEKDLPPVDVCRNCSLLWLDPHEYEALFHKSPPEPAPAAKPHLPPPEPLAGEVLSVEQMGLAEAKRQARLATQQRQADPFRVEEVEAPLWQWGGFFLGLPLEVQGPRLHQKPWITWGLTAVISLVSILAFQNLQAAFAEWALIPTKPWRYGGLTLLTCFFLHADWWHLLGNMYFLLLFGAHVEDYLGKVRIVLLLVLATVAGGLLHIAFTGQPDAPTIGASGGISGLIALYALRFRRAQVLILLLRFWPARFSVGTYVLIWVAMQAVGVALQFSGSVGTAYLAHVGGFAVGALFWWQDHGWKWSWSD
jgi:membrane associated rhomboid family serine protease